MYRLLFYIVLMLGSSLGFSQVNDKIPKQKATETNKAGVLPKSLTGKDTGNQIFAIDTQRIPLNNAIELSKALVRYKKNLTNYDERQSVLRKKVIGSLLWYANAQDYKAGDQLLVLVQATRNYGTLNTHVLDIINTDGPKPYDGNVDSVDYDLIKDTLVKKTLKEKVSEIIKWKLRIAALENKLKEIPSEELLANSKIDYQSRLDKMKLSDTSSVTDSLKALRDNIAEIEADQKIVNSFKTASATLKSLKDSCDKYIEEKKEELVDFNARIKGNWIESIGKMNPEWQQGATQAYLKGNEHNLNLYIQQSSQSEHGLKLPGLPSETEMIDALAIYLTNRVKQEAVMWFFETITANAERYKLIQTFFPATIGLLQSNEVYDIPNLGVQWRYALSRDFVRMPENLFKSSWLKERLPLNKRKYLPFLCATAEMADLIQQRYSYRDLIKSMYLKYNNAVGDAKTVTPLFALLYAVNNELYIASNDSAKSYRMATYEDLRYMTKEELEIMFSLINLKYNDCISAIMPEAFNSFTLKMESVEKVRMWLGGIEQAIQQLNNIREEYNELQKRTDKKAEQEVLYNTYNVWNFVSHMLDMALPDSISENKGNYSNDIRSAFQYMHATHEAYSQISTRNFAGAVNTIIQLLDNLFYTDAEYVFGAGRLEPVATKDSTQKNEFLKTRLQQLLQSSAHVSKEKRKIVKSTIDSLSRILAQQIESVYIPDDSVRMFKLDAAFSNADNELANTIAGKIMKPIKTDDVSAYGLKTRSSGDSIYISFGRDSRFSAVYFEHERHAMVILRKLAGFLNDVALAEDSKTLAKVVESYALPPGSYKRKRNSWWSIDLNAFTGLYIGYETTEKGKRPERSTGMVYGLSAPIGLSISKTFGKRVADRMIEEKYNKNPNMLKLGPQRLFKRSLHTFTFTMSIVDIAAVVSYRFSNTRDSILPHNVKWNQLISPGAHLSYGIPKTPLVINTGIQFTPELRRLEAKVDRQLDVYRLYLGVYFDIPLFNLWERRNIVYYKK